MTASAAPPTVPGTDAAPAAALPAAPTPRLRIAIELQPETEQQHWHAVVLGSDGRPSFESDSPLELVRHLARLARRAAPDPSTRGLR